MNLVTLIWNFIVTLFFAIGNAICPNGCSISICQKYLGVDFCVFDYELAIRIFFGIVIEFLTIFIWMGIITTYFILDVSVFFLSGFFFLISRYIPPASVTQLSSFISNTGFNNLANVYAPTTVQALIQFDLFFENVAFILIDLFAGLLDAGFSIGDALICNIILDPFQCLGYKICSTFFKPFWLQITATISVYVDLNTAICRNVLGIDPINCAYSCDRCAYKPFGLTLYLEWWKFANGYWLGNQFAGYSFTPCNLKTGCCNIYYTTLQTLVP